jgi:hypothetical protein
MIRRSESDSYDILSFELWVMDALFKSCCTCHIFLSPASFVPDGSWRRQPVPLPGRRAIPRPAARAASKCFHLHKNGPKSHFRITEGEECTEVPNISNKHSNIQDVAVDPAIKGMGSIWCFKKSSTTSESYTDLFRNMNA